MIALAEFSNSDLTQPPTPPINAPPNAPQGPATANPAAPPVTPKFIALESVFLSNSVNPNELAMAAFATRTPAVPAAPAK